MRARYPGPRPASTAFGPVAAPAVHLMLMRVVTIGLAVIVRSSAGAITVLVVLLFTVTHL